MLNRGLPQDRSVACTRSSAHRESHDQVFMKESQKHFPSTQVNQELALALRRMALRQRLGHRAGACTSAVRLHGEYIARSPDPMATHQSAIDRVVLCHSLLNSRCLFVGWITYRCLTITKRKFALPLHFRNVEMPKTAMYIMSLRPPSNDRR